MDLFAQKATVLLEVLQEYDAATMRLCEVDLQQEDMMFAIDDIETIITEREEIRERSEVLRTEMLAAISELDEQDSELVRGVFEGRGTGDFPARKVILQLLNLQKDIVEKDKGVIEKLTVKQDEIKDSLKELQGDKKKLDFLNVTAVSEEPESFNV